MNPTVSGQQATTSNTTSGATASSPSPASGAGVSTGGLIDFKFNKTKENDNRRFAMDVDDTSTGEDASQQSVHVSSAKPGTAAGAVASGSSGPASLHLTSDEVNYLIYR